MLLMYTYEQCHGILYTNAIVPLYTGYYDVAEP